MKLKAQRLFYGWWIVVACSLIMVYIGGVIHFGFTAIFEPISKEFGWDYVQISLAVSMRGIETSLLAPLMGLLVDRWGPRVLLFWGCVITGASMILLGRITSLWMFYGVFFLMAIGNSASGYTVMMTAISNWFQNKISTAAGLLASIAATGGLLVPVVTGLIDLLGWRNAMVLLGIGTWVVGIPLSLLVRNYPEPYGVLPDGAEPGNGLDRGRAGEEKPAKAHLPARRALASRAFWHMALAFACYSFVINAVVTHVMPYLSSIGISRTVASLVASAMPVASIAGRFGFGWIGDRINKRKVSAACFLIMGLGLVIFDHVTAGGVWLFALFFVVFGLGWGGNVTLRTGLVRDYFGREKFGTMYGFLVGVMMLGSILGAPVAGWVFDRRGSYDGVWTVFAGMNVVAMLLVATMPQK
ncbi:MAG: MFS transporter, partial [Desulfobacterales bacterium]|nr:MFS transporter [Desulfobacterales bacterium]